MKAKTAKLYSMGGVSARLSASVFLLWHEWQSDCRFVSL